MKTATSPSPLLGQAGGTYQEKQVAMGLRRHFASSWVRRTSGPPQSTVIIPDGSADLIWKDGRLFVAGPDRSANFSPPLPPTVILGFRFQPGIAGDWLGIPSSEIVGKRIPLAAVNRKECAHLMELLGGATDPGTAASRLEQGLFRLSGAKKAPDPLYAGIMDVLQQLPDMKGDITRELTGRLGLTERTLRRRCGDSFGFGPKTLDRILRIQRFIGMLASRPQLGLSELAAEAGYADQSHMTREAKEMAGLTPKAIQDQLTASDIPRDVHP